MTDLNERGIEREGSVAVETQVVRTKTLAAPTAEELKLARSRLLVVIERIPQREPISSISYVDSTLEGDHSSRYSSFAFDPKQDVFEVPIDVAVSAITCYHCDLPPAQHANTVKKCLHCGSNYGDHTGELRCRDQKTIAKFFDEPVDYQACPSGEKGVFYFKVKEDSRVRLKGESV